MICATCLSLHESSNDAPGPCDLFAPTDLNAFHASRLTRDQRLRLHETWKENS